LKSTSSTSVRDNVIIGTGIGIRDPWPADEPRFASLARDMALSGEWLFPRVGGDLYQDKPPLFFWMLAACYAVLGSIRWSFLLPSFLAAGGILFLIYDFGRRLVGREAGLAAARRFRQAVRTSAARASSPRRWPSG